MSFFILLFASFRVLFLVLLPSFSLPSFCLLVFFSPRKRRKASFFNFNLFFFLLERLLEKCTLVFFLVECRENVIFLHSFSLIICSFCIIIVFFPSFLPFIVISFLVYSCHLSFFLSCLPLQSFTLSLSLSHVPSFTSILLHLSPYLPFFTSILHVLSLFTSLLSISPFTSVLHVLSSFTCPFSQSTHHAPVHQFLQSLVEMPSGVLYHSYHHSYRLLPAPLEPPRLGHPLDEGGQRAGVLQAGGRQGGGAGRGEEVTHELANVAPVDFARFQWQVS